MSILEENLNSGAILLQDGARICANRMKKVTYIFVSGISEISCLKTGLLFENRGPTHNSNYWRGEQKIIDWTGISLLSMVGGKQKGRQGKEEKYSLVVDYLSVLLALSD